MVYNGKKVRIYAKQNKRPLLYYKKYTYFTSILLKDPTFSYFRILKLTYNYMVNSIKTRVNK